LSPSRNAAWLDPQVNSAHPPGAAGQSRPRRNLALHSARKWQRRCRKARRQHDHRRIRTICQVSPHRQEPRIGAASQRSHLSGQQLCDLLQRET
jgi:hypothetical protein